MKRLLGIFSIIFLSLIISACGNTDKEQAENKETGSKEEQNLLDKVKAEGKLRIGTEGTYAPFTFHDESGKLTGFDVELATEVAKRLGVEPEFMETQWDAMFAGLDSERFDMIANQVGIRPDRQEKYDFSNHYISSPAVLIAHKDNDAVKGFEDIKGLKSAQSLTSNYSTIAKDNGAEIVGVEGFNQAIDLINSKRADVTINDKLSVLDLLKQKPDTPIKIVAEHEDASRSGFMFRKSNTELVDAVNKALQDIIDDGTYEEISKKWFGENVLN
ncbi:amino acid ABC transporter substrate-binding protein [Bacillus sp. 31A1R]|uniref:Amino acid ABC transporter substrate-binding protein n=1 Tax=Robertmurraya mangrovi TaxID=3098077 RepID=A0ABU5IYI9_9BACI|nr:amino acid ABC transporter substrate-binding protein [Bacillus sp. 31A1R]MDZ5472196.1 amino acid ABC transporter substrate-binding protein [Bacillus sp. 31A1R]